MFGADMLFLLLLALKLLQPGLDVGLDDEAQVPRRGVPLLGEQIEQMDVYSIMQKGISMIHQEILMIPELTVAQNIFLGREMKRAFLLDEKAINQQAEDLLLSMGLQIHCKTKAKYLSLINLE